MKHLFGGAAGGIVFLAASSALCNSSTYTDVTDKSCKILSEEEGMSAESVCKGLGDYPVYIKDGDARVSVFYGPIADDIVKEGFESFSAFNNIGDKIEWRLDDSGKPFAAILRWRISNPDSEKSLGQVLVVSRVAQPDDGNSCVVGYVDARSNKNANELARQVADKEALNFGCGYNEPFWYGERGPLSGENTNYLPERLKLE